MRFNLPDLARMIEKAVQAVLSEGFRTADLYAAGTTKLSCTEMGDRVAEKIKEI